MIDSKIGFIVVLYVFLPDKSFKTQKNCLGTPYKCENQRFYEKSCLFCVKKCIFGSHFLRLPLKLYI